MTAETLDMDPVPDGPTLTEVRIEAVLHAPPRDVWRALTEEIGQWWPSAFYTGGVPGERGFFLEARPGGRMFEDWGDGDGLLWADVVMVKRERELAAKGYAFPAWGGPSIWFGTWTLDPVGADQTRLGFVEAALGRVSEDYDDEKEKGWRFLWDRALRAHVEGTEPPVWGD